MTSHPAVLGKLAAVQVVPAGEGGGMQVFGLAWPVAPGLDYATLDEALAQGNLEIAEIGEAGQVPAIRVTNKAERMVFLMAGEILVGCKQDRVLNTSLMVPAKSEQHLPVSCVEAGRWGYRSRSFDSSRSSSHSLLRRMMSRQTSASYRSSGVAGSDQAAVWAEVRRKIGTMGSRSATQALDQVFSDQEKRLEEFLSKLAVPQGCSGSAFAIRGQIVGADLFDKPDTLAKLWPKLIRGYALDALEPAAEKPGRAEPDGVRVWLNSARSAKEESFASPALGQDVRIEGPQLAGAALVVNQQPVHLQLFHEP